MLRLALSLWLVLFLALPLPAAYDFGAVTSDRINTSSPQNQTVRTVSIWTWRDGDGGLGFGHVWSGQFDTNRLSVLDGSTLTLRFDWSTTDGEWKFDKPGTGAWHHIAITYDASLTTNDPSVLVDGAAATNFAETVAPVGTFAPNGTWMLGNHNGNTVAWDGRLAEAAIWNRVLTAGELGALAKGYSPLFFTNGLVVYYPLIRELRDYKLATLATATGAVPIAHPRIIYPRGLRWESASSVAGGSAVKPYLLQRRRRF